MYPVFQYSIIQYIIFYLFLTLTATSIILLFFMMLQLPYTLLLNKNKSTLESGFDRNSSLYFSTLKLSVVPRINSIIFWSG